MTAPTPFEVAAYLLERDRASAELGIELVAAEPGTATVQMAVTDRHINGHGVCHGGYVFTLADTALAFASNGSNINSLSTNLTIDLVDSTPVGETLRATASEIHRRGKSGLYTMVVSRSDGVNVAFLRGHTLEVGGAVVQD